jgi:TolB-like protein/cytochrome c-type biogenesis protein CcmH/NrfG
MTENAKSRLITIDLSQFKLHIHVQKKIELTLHFNSPSRRFYLSLIAFVVNEMKRQGKLASIPLESHHAVLALLNETVGGSAGSSEKQDLLPRIYRKWRHALPNLEEAPLFKVLGRKKEYMDGASKTYPFTENAKDSWANLFEYKGSEENVRLKFAIDKIGAGLGDIEIIYEGFFDGEAWERFLFSLKGKAENESEMGAIQSPSVAAEPSLSLPRDLGITRRGSLRRVAIAGMIAIILGTGALIAWTYHVKPDPNKRASVERMAFPLPDKPSIAVLPFDNMSGDPKQDYFSDGITEEIISTLSRISGLFVIARNSSFTYKGKAVWVPDVARDLGVGYILEGSVRRSGDRVRITAQLIDGKTNQHIWSETYDRELKDIFAVQDEITMKILTNVKIKLTGDEDQTLAAAKRSTNLQAYLKILEGIANQNESRFSEAKKAFEEALSLDPKSPAYGWVAWTYLMDVWFGPTATRAQSLGKAFEYAKKCIEQDDSNEGCNRTLGHAYLLKRDYEKALYYGKRSIELNPNSTNSASMFGWTLRSVGRFEEAIREYERAMRLDPKCVELPLTQLGTTYVMMGRYEEAIEALRKSLGIKPRNLAAWITLVMAYSSLDRMEEARAAAAEVLKLNPNFSVEPFSKAMPYKNPETAKFMVDALRKAGMK